MKKLLFSIFAAALALTGTAANLDVNGDFAKIDSKTKLPLYWKKNVWSGYKPFADAEVVKEDGKNVLHVFNVKSKKGYGLSCSQNFAAEAGDTVTVTAQVKGKGSGSFGLQFRDEKRNHRGRHRPTDFQHRITFLLQRASLIRISACV